MSTTYSSYLSKLNNYITQNMGSKSDTNNKEFNSLFNYINRDGSVDLLDLTNQNNYNNFANNITTSNIMKSFVLNTTYYDTSVSTNNPNYELFTRNPPWAMYFAEDYDAINHKIYDSSGNNREALTGGNGTITKVNSTGSGESFQPTYIQGDINSSINFGNQSIPENFTIASITAYVNGGINGRILQGKNTDWYQGHNNNKVGVCKYGSVLKTNIDTVSSSDWVKMIGKNTVNGNNAYNILYNGRPIGITGAGTGNDILTINNSIITNDQNSNWKLCCVIIWDKNLSDTDSSSLYTFLNNYMNGSVTRSSLITQNTNLVNTSQLLFNSTNNFSDVTKKYLFLFDVLTSLYSQIYKNLYGDGTQLSSLNKNNILNNLNKNDILNLLKNGIEIKTNIQAYQGTNNNFVLTYSPTQISFITNDLYNANIRTINYVKNISNNSSSSNININGYNVLFNLIKNDLLNHVNFIKNYDIYQATSYYAYYKLCYTIFKYNLQINNNVVSTLAIGSGVTPTNLFTNISSDIAEINSILEQYNPLDSSNNIINNMNSIGSLNTQLRKINSNINVKSNQYKSYEKIITNTNYIELISIAILVIIIISGICLPLTSDKLSLLTFNIILLIITILIFIYIYIYLKYYYNINENFIVNNSPLIIMFSDTFNNIILTLKKTNISVINYITKNAVDSEKNKYDSIVNTYQNYSKYTIDDMEVASVDHAKKLNKIICLFIISILIILINICYIYNYLILAFSILILILIVIIYYYYNKYDRYVNTQSNKYYWRKPYNSL